MGIAPLSRHRRFARTRSGGAMQPRSIGLTLVLGGARSGKSRHAEHLAAESGLVPVYLATAQALDAEMTRRIAAHRTRRGTAWRTVEEPLDLVGVLQRECAPGRIVLADCLTLWLSNLMAARRAVEAESARLLEALPGLSGSVLLVSNEVGQGVVPDNAMARQFIDHAGFLHQGIAEQADAVVFMTAGLPHHLK
jgi:adenosylcobinamide kinase/adenosylcobinamide-phosphate guanylyltransferase